MKTYKVTVDEEGTTRWYNEKGYYHREDGPAIEWANGDKSWYINDKLHREDGPAVEWSTGDKAWFLNGKRHREDGPAIEYADGDKRWFINGKELTEKKFNNQTKPCIGKKVVVDGIEYTLK